MADRLNRHAQSLVNGEVFETARLLRLACAKSIRAREPETLPNQRPDICLQLTCPVTEITPCHAERTIYAIDTPTVVVALP